jgi:hypothetical protein
VQDLSGLLKLRETTFVGNKGVMGSTNLGLFDQGFHSVLIAFKNVVLSSLTFSGLTFDQNRLAFRDA